MYFSAGGTVDDSYPCLGSLILIQSVIHHIIGVSGNEATLKLLLEKGFNPNLKDLKGRTLWTQRCKGLNCCNATI
jgi:hypothetical protein